jgi:hypothetical protein
MLAFSDEQGMMQTSFQSVCMQMNRSKFDGEGAELAFNRTSFDQVDREGIVRTINPDGRYCLTVIGRGVGG